MMMRRFVLAVAFSVLATPSPAGGLSSVGDDAYGCNTMAALAQLRLMSAIRTAFEIALADKVERGECVNLNNGESLVKVGQETIGNVVAVKVRRASGDEVFVELRFVQPSI
jgi:hypothetical protein